MTQQSSSRLMSCMRPCSRAFCSLPAVNEEVVTRMPQPAFFSSNRVERFHRLLGIGVRGHQGAQDGHARLGVESVADQVLDGRQRVAVDDQRKHAPVGVGAGGGVDGVDVDR